MRIFLTGGTGFIGSHFINQSHDAGHEIIALRRSNESIPRIPLNQQPHWLNCQLDEVTIDELIGCDVLLHLAAHSVNYPFDSLANCFRWNVTAVLTLFEQARLAGIKNYVVAGTCSEYGRSGERYKKIPTNAPLEPINTYAASKAAASIALLQWAEEFHLNLEILRVFNLFGDGQNKLSFWPLLRNAAMAGEDFLMTGGEQVREFMSVEYASSIFLERATAPRVTPPTSRVFNLSNSNPISVRAFAEYWWDHWNAKGKLLIGALPYRTGEVFHYEAGPVLLQCAKK